MAKKANGVNKSEVMDAREPEPGDIVRFKLSPSGYEGTCLLTEEGSAGNGGKMFLGHEELKSKDEVGIRVVHLYPSDVTEILVNGWARCRNTRCGRRWAAVWPHDVGALECPSCGEMSGAPE